MILYLSALRILVNQFVFGNFANPFITTKLALHENILKLFLISKYILILTFWNIYWIFSHTFVCVLEFIIKHLICSVTFMQKKIVAK